MVDVRKRSSTREYGWLRLGVWFLAMVVLLSLTGIGCRTQTAPDTVDSQRGGTLVLGTTFEPISLDLLVDERGGWPHDAICEGLFVEDPLDGTFKPASFIKSYSISDDQLAWTFHIKPGSKFHDGTSLNAEAIKWFYEMAMVGEPAGYMWTKIEEIEIVEEYVVRFLLSEPDPNFQFNAGQPSYMGILSPTAYEKYGQDYGVKAHVSTGPFKFVEWAKGDQLVVERWDEYPGLSWTANEGPAYLDRIVFKFFKDEAAYAMAVEAGAVHVGIEVPPGKIASWKDRGWIVSKPGTTMWFAVFNAGKEPFTDVTVRRALSYAIDREAIAEHVWFGEALPAYVAVPQTLGADVPAVWYHDPGKAAALLEEAGWTLGADGIRVRDGKKLSFNFWSLDDSTARRMAEIIQEQWRGIGVDARLSSFDLGTFLAKTRAEEHEVNLWWHMWPNPDILDWQFNPSYAGYPNQARFDTLELRKLIDDAWAASTWEEYVHRFTLVHQYVLDNALQATVVFPNRVMVVREEVAGWDYNFRFPKLQNVYFK